MREIRGAVLVGFLPRHSFDLRPLSLLARSLSQAAEKSFGKSVRSGYQGADESFKPILVAPPRAAPARPSAAAPAPAAGAAAAPQPAGASAPEDSDAAYTAWKARVAAGEVEEQAPIPGKWTTVEEGEGMYASTGMGDGSVLEMVEAEAKAKAKRKRPVEEGEFCEDSSDEEDPEDREAIEGLKVAQPRRRLEPKPIAGGSLAAAAAAPVVGPDGNPVQVKQEQPLFNAPRGNTNRSFRKRPRGEDN
eukprot:m51a1_g14040 hypothetical protein (247) ;mRNA; r:1174385-1175125